MSKSPSQQGTGEKVVPFEMWTPRDEDIAVLLAATVRRSFRLDDRRTRPLTPFSLFYSSIPLASLSP